MNKLLFLVATLFLAGCATQPKPIYYWGDYQEALYQHYTPGKSSPQEQIALLLKTQEKAKSKNLPVPPGFNAQLGMLYNETGQIELARERFAIEKSQFPESAVYMDFLLGKKG